MSGRRYPFDVVFDGSSCPARIGGEGDPLPGLYIDLGHLEHVVAGDHPLLAVVGCLLLAVEDARTEAACYKAAADHFRGMALLAGTLSASTLPVQIEDTGALSGCRGAVPCRPQPFSGRSEALGQDTGRGAAPFLSGQGGARSDAQVTDFGVEQSTQPGGLQVDREGQPLISLPAASGEAAAFSPQETESWIFPKG